MLSDKLRNDLSVETLLYSLEPEVGQAQGTLVLELSDTTRIVADGSVK